MKKIISRGSFLVDNIEYPIWGNNTDKKVFEPILTQMYNQIRSMLFYHSRVLVLRFEFRPKKYSECNKIVSEFFRVLLKQMTQHYKMKRIGYAWVREQHTSELQHYHCCLILNANKVNYPDSVFKRMQRIVSSRNLPCIWVPEHPYYSIHRGDDAAFSEAFERISYMAKVSTKDKRTGANNDYSTSRIKC